jgi:hypothetical protein
MELKQLTAIFGILAFLGTFAAVALSAAAIVMLRIAGEDRIASWTVNASTWFLGGRGLAQKIALVVMVLLVGYASVLLGASAASREQTLAGDQEKYFCEIDCHLAYSVVDIERAKIQASGATEKTADGILCTVSVRTRFDEKTISAHRGDSPLTPSPRAVSIVDDRGRIYPSSDESQQASLAKPLRPGESYITKLVFNLPSDAQDLRLLITSPTEPGWLGRVIIGDEDSIFHKKIYLRLPS